jgi:hypothetical protein
MEEASPHAPKHHLSPARWQLGFCPFETCAKPATREEPRDPRPVTRRTAGRLDTSSAVPHGVIRVLAVMHEAPTPASQRHVPVRCVTPALAPSCVGRRTSYTAGVARSDYGEEHTSSLLAKGRCLARCVCTMSPVAQLTASGGHCSRYRTQTLPTAVRCPLVSSMATSLLRYVYVYV